MTTTMPEEFTIQEEFPEVGYDEWRSLVEASLNGAPFDRKLVKKTYDGVEIQPVYTRRDETGGDDAFGFPGLAPFVRGGRALGSAESGWDLRQEYTHPDPRATNQQILADLSGGVTSLHVKLDLSSRQGYDPDADAATDLVGRDGVMVYSVEDLDAVFAGVHLDMIQVAIDAGSAFLPAAAMLVGLWQRRNIEPEEAAGAFNADPLGTLAGEGHLPVTAEKSLALMADLAAWTAENHPRVTAVGVDTSCYHNAGATAAQDIALAAATGVQYLRTLTSAGMDVDSAAAQILFRMSLGTHHFQGIAKLRAARCVWARVVEASGGSASAQAMRIHARTSDRALTQHAPYVNLLRNTVAVFAAGTGGADAITSVPFDSMIGLPDDFSRKVARNTAHILQEESHLHRVIDPAGGSWFLDRLTEDLASQAWQILQETERQGGMLKSLRSGWVAGQIEAAFLPRANDIAQRKTGLTGISEFADITEKRIAKVAPDRASLRATASQKMATLRRLDATLASLELAQDHSSPAVTAAADGATIGQMGTALGFRDGHGESIPALRLHRFAEPFEQLRDSCEAWEKLQGHRPRVFLASFGPVSHYTARATWSKNFFEAGGFEVIGTDGFEDADAAATAFVASAASVAVICSSDRLYPDVVPQAAAKLKATGAGSIVLAGHPGDNEQSWRESGVDRFIFMKCNVLEILRELLTGLGVVQNGAPTR